MTDQELNRAIHTEVEGWQWVADSSTVAWKRGASDWSDTCTPPDYCHDAAWCLDKLKTLGLSIDCYNYLTDKPVCIVQTGMTALIKDVDPCRAIALAVLELTPTLKGRST